MPTKPTPAKTEKAPAKKPRKTAARKKASEPKQPRGRPSRFTNVVADEICNRIAEGKTLREICRDEAMPGWRTVYDWINTRPEFSARIARARELGFQAIAEETLEIIDEEPGRVAVEFGTKVDPGHVAWMKARVEQRMKLLSKWDSGRYGDKVVAPAGGGAGAPGPNDAPAAPAKLTSVDPIEASREYQKLMEG